ncbi:MAG: hypothetical protein AB7U98_15245 [Candidatus Nitrosocosmicus sp.]|jgi:hypothetical protein|uniref:hypothetical protein n=1 Tax=Candidatus Nitrosocosmicus sp. FF01 TaxID=3397670 RepID=UPI002A6F63A6|nr:hypothetical protein [Candidatus Nitrosocosmicus sp.]
MKIVTLNLYVFFVLTAVLVTGSLVTSQTTFSSAQIVDPKNVYSISKSNYAHSVDTFVWSSPSTSSSFSSSTTIPPTIANAATSSSINAEMSDVLTASFTNIIDTQIYTGLDRLTN